jgi:hypothetical protein
MKNFFVLLITVFTSYAATAKNYYVALNGNDGNNGTTATTPWKTISKVNASFSVITAGDSILFKCGDSFYGALVIGKSGASGRPIVIGSYGTGAKPVITGFVTVSSWTNAGNGIYETSVPAVKNALNMVTINNAAQAMGRYPNIDAGNGGYLNYETFSGSTGITDNQLTSTTNWTGAEVVVRKKLWVLDRCKVTAHNGGAVSFTNIGSTYTGTNGFGYFFQNDVRTLDKFGEWFFANKVLKIYFGTASPSSYSVKVSCLDTLVTLSSKSYITLSNLAFDGANGNALLAKSGSNVTIQNCDFNNSGIGAINTTGISNQLIENCLINNSLSNGIMAMNSSGSNVTIRGNTIKNTGILAGMGLSGGNSYKGIMTSSASSLLIEYNVVDTTGYVGIEFQGSNVNVRYNLVNYFDFVKDDAGGIYTYHSGTDASPGTIYTNRTISNNIVMNGAGAPYGRNSSTLFVTGIYLDGRTMNVNVLNNTVFNNGKNGVHCNNPQNVIIRGNTSYNNLNAVSVMRWANIGAVRNLSIKNNILYPKQSDQRCFYYCNSGLNEPVTTSIQSALTNLASIDSNTYGMMNPVGFNFEVYNTSGGAFVPTSPYSFEAWRTVTNHDANGKKVAKLPVTYKLTGLVGSNKFTNGLFNTTVSGLSVYGTSITTAWDNTGKISGGSLRIGFSAPAAMRFASVIGAVGAVSTSKKYVLRFSTYGTSNQGFFRVYMRKTASPNTSLISSQSRSFGIGRKDHEIFFNGPTTDAGASFIIEIEQNSGTTYIDNLEFYEVSAIVYDPVSQFRFEYNATKAVKTITLDGNYTGVNGTVYTGSISLQPFTSLILIKDTATTTTAPVANMLKASASATTINCYGGNSNVSVSASGGTAPYTGTGTFTAKAGKGTYKVTFPTSRPGIYSMFYYTIGSIQTDKNYVLRFSTLGTTDNGSVRAAIRQTNTPWSTVVTKQTGTFGTTRKDHEFIFKTPPAQTAASFLIEIEQSSGTTYIDNVAFFECDSSGVIKSDNLFTDGQFENASSRLFDYSYNFNHILQWDTTGKINAVNYYKVTDVMGAVSMVPVVINQPAAPLEINANAGIITVLNGTTSVTVGASGGSAPYTGTGIFSSIQAGTYTYTVTDAFGCTASKTVSILPFVSARPSLTTAARAPASASGNLTGKTITLTAYPNPFNSEITVQLRGGTNEKITISIFAIDSRLVYQTTGGSNINYTIGKNLSAGVYIVKVQQGTAIQTVKVVKSVN